MKRFCVVLLSAMLAFGLVACGSSSSSNDEGSNGEESGEIKLGAWIATSGALAYLGVPIKEGVDAYFNHVNENGGVNGKQINWIVHDDAYDPQKTLQIARELVQRDEVVSIFGALGTPGTEATFDFVLGQSETPIVGAVAGISSWYDPPRDGLWGMYLVANDATAAAAEWAAEDGNKNVVVFHTDITSYAEAAEAAQDVLAEKNIDVTLVSVKQGTTDYAPIVSEIRQMNPDAIIPVVANPELVAYLKEADRQSVEADIYGYTPQVTNDLIDLGGPLAEGVRGIAATKSPADTSSQEVQDYVEHLKAVAPGSKPDFYGLQAYGHGVAMVDALEQIEGEITPEKVNEAMEGIETIETGILPTLDFTRGNQNGAINYFRMQVSDGEWAQQGDSMETIG